MMGRQIAPILVLAMAIVAHSISALALTGFGPLIALSDYVPVVAVGHPHQKAISTLMGL